MSRTLTEYVVLNNGKRMPSFGLGVFRISNQDTKETVKNAILTGYRLIDTAHIYGNEEGVGLGIKEALAETGLKRSDLFITSKLWNDGLSYQESLDAYYESLRKLDLEYLDLYLLHWPGPNSDFKDQWLALEKLYQDGKVKAIGVCNFNISHLEYLLSFATITPVINQVELSPRLTQKQLYSYCMDKHIYLQCWSALMKGEVFEIKELQALANKYHKDVAQIVIKWLLQSNILALIKTEKLSRLISNAALDDFFLSDAEMEIINNLNQDSRRGPDPLIYNFGK